MFSKMLDRIFGPVRSKRTADDNVNKDQNNTKRIIDIASAEEAIKNGKTEVLDDGFVYRYPVTDGNTTIFPNNIQAGVDFIMSAKNEDEKEARKGLCHQIMKRETKQMMDALEKRIKRKISEDE